MYYWDEIRVFLKNNVVWPIGRWCISVKYWIKYRLNPKKYNLLQLHEPGYRDPRYQLIFAVMNTVERYIEELRLNSFTKDLSEHTRIGVIQEYIDWYEEMKVDPNPYSGYSVWWHNHFVSLHDLWSWWEEVKDGEDLDSSSKAELELLRKEVDSVWDMEVEGDEFSSDVVDERLHQAINLRGGMWT